MPCPVWRGRGPGPDARRPDLTGAGTGRDRFCPQADGRLRRRHDGGSTGLRAGGRAGGNHALQVYTAYDLGQVYAAIGDFGRAVELQQWNVEAADRVSDTFGPSLRSLFRARLARTLSNLGAFAEGRHHGEEALRLATLDGRGQAPVVALGSLSELYLVQGDLAHAIPALEQGLAVCRASGALAWWGGIALDLGAVYTLQGRLAEGRALLEEAARTSLPHGVRRAAYWMQRSENLSAGGTRRGGLAARVPGARLGPAAQGAREPGTRRCTSLASSMPTAIPRCHTGRSPLPAGPGPGRGTGHAPARGPLPPRPGHPVRRDRSAGAGPHRTGYRHRVVPRHGHGGFFGCRRRKPRLRRWKGDHSVAQILASV